MTFHRRGITSSVSVTSLAQLGQALAATGRARARRRHNDALARQMRPKRLPGRALALEGCNTVGCRRGLLGHDLVFAGVGPKFFQAQFELVGQALAALGAGTVLVTPQQCDLLLEMRNQCVSSGSPRLSCRQLDPHRRHHRLERVDVIGKNRGGGRHGRSGAEGVQSTIIPARLRQLLNAPMLTQASSPRAGWAPAHLRVPPVDAVEQAGELRTRQRHRADGQMKRPRSSRLA